MSEIKTKKQKKNVTFLFLHVEIHLERELRLHLCFGQIGFIVSNRLLKLWCRLLVPSDSYGSTQLVSDIASAAVWFLYVAGVRVSHCYS